MNEIDEEKRLLLELKEEIERQQSILSLERETLEGEKEVLKEQKASFEKQKHILETGFKKLAADREMFLAEKKRLIREINSMEFQSKEDIRMQKGRFPGFFGGVEDFLSLKKRYKDLMKLYHPDNRHGDEFTVMLINKEFETLKQRFEEEV